MGEYLIIYRVENEQAWILRVVHGHRDPEFTALAVAALFPIGKSAFELAYHRQLDPISILVLLGIAADSVALLFGGSPRLLLVRESLITGVFGLACFSSLLWPRPLMFYFAR